MIDPGAERYTLTNMLSTQMSIRRCLFTRPNHVADQIVQYRFSRNFNGKYIFKIKLEKVLFNII